MYQYLKKRVKNSLRLEKMSKLAGFLHKKIKKSLTFFNLKPK